MQNYEMVLPGGFSLIHGPNESGKTTVQHFILAMFYGLGRSGKNPESSLRLRFKPWHDGRFGGRIYFELGQRELCLEREFGASKRDDRCKLSDSQTQEVLAVRNPDMPGEELFGLSRDEYLNSSFALAAQASLAGQKTLEERIRRVLNGGEEDCSYDELELRLKQARKKLLSERRDQGLIVELAHKIEANAKALARASLRDQQQLLFSRRQEELRGLAKLAEEEARVGTLEKEHYEKQRMIERHRKYRRLQQDYRSASAELDGLRELGVIELTALSTQRAHLSQTQSRYELAVQTELQKEAECEGFVNRARAAISDIVLRREQIELQLEQLEKPFREVPNPPRVPHVLYPLLIVEGLLILFGLFLRDSAVAISRLSIVAACLLPLVAAYVLFHQNLKREQAIRNNLESRRKNEVELVRRDNELNQLDWDLKRTRQQIKESDAELLQTQQFRAQIERELLEEQAGLLLKIQEYTGKKVEAEDMDFWIQELRDRSYKGDNARKTCERLEREILEFLGDESETDLANAYEEAQHWIYDHQAKLGTFANQTPEESERRHLEALKKQSELGEELAVLANELEHLRSEDGDTADLQHEQRLLLETREKYKQRIMALDLALALVTRERNDFDRGLRPELNRRSAEYLSTLTNEKYDKVKFGPEWNIVLSGEAEPGYHEDSFYSAGTRDLIWLSLRLALRDLLSDGRQKMPLVLDDSLSQLDLERSKRALELLNRLGSEGENQILLFSSSEQLFKLADENSVETISI